jgi:hypothetical protein
VQVVVGLLFMAGAVFLFVSRERFLAAQKASSAVLFGRADPHRRAPRFTAMWNLVIVMVVCTVLLVVGVLILLGVVGLDEN